MALETPTPAPPKSVEKKWEGVASHLKEWCRKKCEEHGWDVPGEFA